MANLRRRDQILLGLFVIVWLFSLVMRAVALSRDAPVPVFVGEVAAGEHPEIRGFLQPEGAALSPLEVGDRVLAVEGQDVTGQGQLALLATLVSATWNKRAPVVWTVQRGDERLVLRRSQPGFRPAGYSTGLVISLAWGIAAVLILLRAAPTATTRALFTGMASTALMYTAYFEGPRPVYLYSLALALITVLVTQPLLLRAYISFPEEANGLHGLHRVWPWVFLGVGLPFFALATGVPLAPDTARRIASVPVIIYVLAILIVFTLNYRNSGPVGRRQIKWILYAVYLGSLLSFVAYGVSGGVPSAGRSVVTASLVMLSSIGFPIMVLIAVLRFDLFDIDRLLGATVAYNVLAVLVVGVGFVIVPPLTEFLASAVAIDPAIGRTVSAMGLAGVVIVAGGRVRPYVDRLFFKERFALEQAMKHLPETFAAARGPNELWETTGAELVDTVRPESCVIFAAAVETFVPVFSDGETVPPAIPGGGELMAWLNGLDGASEIDRAGAQRAGVMGQAMLANLEARVVVPIHRQATLEAFICLGRKRSGDIYTRTDLSLLTTLAKSLSIHLLRFDEAELLERTQAIQQRMQRYVPGALAELIVIGDDLETGEREVCVLFVDIRGYTAYAHGRDASATFSTVNRYTETVSGIVNDCGGVVVEFNGDGMMAVFGAPRPLADKETAAVRAARRMVEEVPMIGDGTPGEDPLSVGVGVATGQAFVGNIEAVDRTIWSAIGSTTNLAARLQALTRELDASVLIDTTTHQRAEAAGGAGAAFERHSEIHIKGRRDVDTVFALPLSTG